MHTIREALLAMAYREAEPGKWVKPVGYCCLLYREEERLWQNWILDKDNVLHIYESKTIKTEDDPLNTLKSFECWTRTDIYNPLSRFEGPAIDL